MSSICLNELSNYNSGRLEFKWFDLDTYTDADDFGEAISAWLTDCNNPDGGECEEWNIADTEDIPTRFYSDYGFDAQSYFVYKELAQEVGEEKLDAYMKVYGELPETADTVHERFFCYTEDYEYSDAFYSGIGWELMDGSGYLSDMPTVIQRYFDYEKYGRDTFINELGCSDGYVFWMR